MRYRRFKRKSSGVIKMRFQSFVDLSTEADNMKIISVNAGGRDVYNRLAPFFSAYKYYKLGSVSIKLIPASTLPVDPTGLSYAEGEQTVDPRDQLTPGMCRITNGEDILEDLTGLSGDEQRSLYNNMLLDPRWYKWMLQTGVKRFAKPKYWQIGQLHQDKWPGAFLNVPEVASASDQVMGTATINCAVKNGTGMWEIPQDSHSSPYGLFQTGNRGYLSWLPTDGLQHYLKSTTGFGDQPFLASIPEIELFKILMPPVHKTNYFYRMFITETVYFKDPMVMNVNGYRPIDVFHYSPGGAPLVPTASRSMPIDQDYLDGGNDGSD